MGLRVIEEMFEIPEVPDPVVDVEFVGGKGAVIMLVERGPADVIVVPAADPVALIEVLELLSVNGGGTGVAEAAAVSFRPADEDVVRKLVGTVTFEGVNVTPVDRAVESGIGPVPVTRVPLNTDADVVLVRGNGAGLVLAMDTCVIDEVDLLVVKMVEVLVFTDTERMVWTLDLADAVLLSSAEEFVLAAVVALGVRIDRGNVLRVDIREDELA